ncbi:GldG family protein [Candidatus Latescibacterota bacterium]
MKTMKSSTFVSLFFLLGILTLVNAISVRNFMRLDLTSSQMYTLTETSKRIVAGIPDNLIVKAYFSPDLPSPHNTVRQYLWDMLEDYRAYSKGHLQYEFVDPGSDEALEQEAQSFQIPPQQFQTIENDKLELKIGYMGVVFVYGDKREVIPVVQGIDNLEYEITSLINRLTSPQLPRLGVTSTGSAENEISTQQLYEALARNFDIHMMDLYTPVPQDYAGIMLIAPREPLTDWQLFNLDQYIMNGGKVAIMANSFEGTFQMMQNNEFFVRRELNLNRILTSYGIRLGDDMLFDNFCGMLTVQIPQGFFVMNQQVRIPYFPIIENFNRENMITRSLERLTLFFPSSVDTTLAAEKGYEVEGLMYTSDFSGREILPSVRINVLQSWAQADFTESFTPVAAIVQGNFTSAFAESGPPPRASEGPNGQIVIEEQPYDGPFKTEVGDINRLLVVGDGNIVLDEYANQYGLTFILNVADWLAQAEDLISIRSKVVTLKPLNRVSDFTRKVVKWSNQVGPVILVIVFGIGLWQVRRIRKKSLMVQ